MTLETSVASSLRYVLRAQHGTETPSWMLSDGARFYAASDRQRYDPNDASAMVRLWEERRSAELRKVEGPIRYLTPLPVARIFCPAVNFASHSAESSMVKPTEPYFFLKFASSAVPHESTVELPRQAEKVDYEGEIGVVLGRRGKHWDRAQAEEAIFGYTVTNDLSLRDYQFREQPRYGKNWVMGKMFDGSLPIGPWILPRELLPDFRATIRTRVNGEVRQEGPTSDMFYTNPELIAYLSEVNTLGPGDVLTTGTPSGVAAHQGQRYLRDGDLIEIEVDPIGTLKHGVRFERRA